MSSASRDDNPLEDLTPELPELWEQQELCDVTLVSAEGQHFRAHKIILAAASRYFQALFVGGGKHLLEGSRAGQGEPSIELEAIDAASLAGVLRSIYHKRVAVDADSVQGLLLAANYLDVAAVREACCQVRGYGCMHCSFCFACCATNCQPCAHVVQFLREHMDNATCLHTLDLAAHCACSELYGAAVCSLTPQQTPLA